MLSLEFPSSDKSGCDHVFELLGSHLVGKRKNEIDQSDFGCVHKHITLLEIEKRCVLGEWIKAFLGLC